MKYLLFISLLITSSAQANLHAQVIGSSIDWPDTSGWMQVQNSATYETICEGFLNTCVVSAGTYNVIDHSSGIRQSGIVVGVTDGSNSTIGSSEIIKKQCDFTLGRLKNTCLIRCPGGMKIERIRRCYAESSDKTQFIGTSFSSSDERLWCSATTDITNFFIVSEIGCR